MTCYRVICLEGQRKTTKRTSVRIAVSLFEKGTFWKQRGIRSSKAAILPSRRWMNLISFGVNVDTGRLLLEVNEHSNQKYAVVKMSSEETKRGGKEGG